MSKAKYRILDALEQQSHNQELLVATPYHTHLTYTFANSSQWASARAVRVVRLVTKADSKTKRLRLLLTSHCIARMYPIQPIIDVCGLSKEMNTDLKQQLPSNSSHLRIVATPNLQEKNQQPWCLIKEIWYLCSRSPVHTEDMANVPDCYLQNFLVLKYFVVYLPDPPSALLGVLLSVQK